MKTQLKRQHPSTLHGDWRVKPAFLLLFVCMLTLFASYNEFGGAMVDYDGFYAPSGDYLFVAYPTYPTICFTANNVGLPEDLRSLEGQPVIVKMKEKGGNSIHSSKPIQQSDSDSTKNIRKDSEGTLRMFIL